MDAINSYADTLMPPNQMRRTADNFKVSLNGSSRSFKSKSSLARPTNLRDRASNKGGEFTLWNERTQNQRTLSKNENKFKSTMKQDAINNDKHTKLPTSSAYSSTRHPRSGYSPAQNIMPNSLLNQTVKGGTTNQQQINNQAQQHYQHNTPGLTTPMHFGEDNSLRWLKEDAAYQSLYEGGFVGNALELSEPQLQEIQSQQDVRVNRQIGINKYRQQAQVQNQLNQRFRKNTSQFEDPQSVARSVIRNKYKRELANHHPQELRYNSVENLMQGYSVSGSKDSILNSSVQKRANPNKYLSDLNQKQSQITQFRRLNENQKFLKIEQQQISATLRQQNKPVIIPSDKKLLHFPLPDTNLFSEDEIQSLIPNPLYDDYEEKGGKTQNPPQMQIEDQNAQSQASISNSSARLPDSQSRDGKKQSQKKLSSAVQSQFQSMETLVQDARDESEAGTFFNPKDSEAAQRQQNRYSQEKLQELKGLAEGDQKVITILNKDLNQFKENPQQIAEKKVNKKSRITNGRQRYGSMGSKQLVEIQKGPVPVELIMENAKMHARELLKREARKDPSLRKAASPLRTQKIDGTNQQFPNTANRKLMIGKTQFKVPVHPNKQAGEQITQKLLEVSKERKISQMARRDSKMVGFIKMRDDQFQQKTMTRRQFENLENYVKNFSETADYVKLSTQPRRTLTGAVAGLNTLNSSQENKGQSMFSFAETMKKKVQGEKKKSDLKAALLMKFNVTQKVAEQGDDADVDKIEEEVKKDFEEKNSNIFSKKNVDEQMALKNIADQLIKRNEYMMRFKNREIEKGAKSDTIEKDNPEVNFFKACQRDYELVLPILGKIYRKTLCLQDYTLSLGQCKGLAAACEHFDHKVVNRVFFNNCGIDGDEFAAILQGLAKIREFKSIIYKFNQINKQSLLDLKPLLVKRLPFNLEEIKLIDVRMTNSILSQFLTHINEQSQLRTLALVNVPHNELTFDKLVEYVENSEFLEDLDVSWSAVRPQVMLRLMRVIRENRDLKSLSISHNSVVERQKYKTDSSNKLVFQTELTQCSLEILDCLKQFTKYNPNLIHLNLSKTELTHEGIMYICHILTRAQSLRCLHLCGNPGLADTSVYEEIRKRIRARDERMQAYIPPYKVSKEPPSPKKPNISMLGRMFKGLGGQDNDKKKQDEESKKWRDLRQGLRLRNIVNSKRMNEIGLSSGYERKKLIIQRHLNLQKVIPKSAQWDLVTGETEERELKPNNYIMNDLEMKKNYQKKNTGECYFCGQHIFTVFVWSPRIGLLNASKDQDLERYYRDKMAEIHDEEFMPQLATTPQIASTFTGWQYHDMQDIKEFVETYDPEPPSYINELIEDGLIRAACGAPDHTKMNEHESNLHKVKMDHYYEENWAKIILKFFPDKNPLITNSDSLSSLSSSVDKLNGLFFYCAWVKPGRHTYLIKHDGDLVYEETAESQYQKKIDNFMATKMSPGKKSDKSFYVHELLAGFRTEPIQPFAKERHTHSEEVKQIAVKHVFAGWNEDQLETEIKCIEADLPQINFKLILELFKNQEEAVKRQIIVNYRLFKTIYHHLQSKSIKYPYVDLTTMRNQFIKKVFASEDGSFVADILNKMQIIFDEISYEFKKQNPKANLPVNSITRSQFIETQIKLAKFLYATQELHALDQQKHLFKDPTQMDYNAVSVSNAISMLIKNKLELYMEAEKIMWQDFRDLKLWVENVEEVFSCNEKAMWSLHNMLSKSRKDTSKGPRDDFVTLNDCKILFTEELRFLGMRKQDIAATYAMSKHTVVNEVDQRQASTYNRITYIEFLEFIARVAELFFEGSEMQELELAKKIEHLLDEILPIVGHKRIKQRTIIEDFSESDDDY